MNTIIIISDVTYYQWLNYIIDDIVVQTLFMQYKCLYCNTGNLKSLCALSQYHLRCDDDAKWYGEWMDRRQIQLLQLEISAG